MRTRDAVLVLPGIMGSELVCTETGRTIWGLRDPRWYLDAWTSANGLAALELSPAERDGRYGRVRATRLLRFTAFAPLLRGFEPYDGLLRGLRRCVLDDSAVAESPYDWRLPAAYNGEQAANAAAEHLDGWRGHPVQAAAQRDDPDGADPMLVLVAHSMGGLVAAHMLASGNIRGRIRRIVTLGTPFFGSPKAAVLLSAGRGAPVPLPRRRLRRLAIGLPSVYELLPQYRCVDTGTEARQLTVADIVGLGGTHEYAERAMSTSEQTRRLHDVDHTQVVGANQPTYQSLVLDQGTAEGRHYTCKPTNSNELLRTDLSGDGTVPRESGQIPGRGVVPLAHNHGALGKADEAVLVVQDALVHRGTGPWQGDSGIGLGLPDVATAGKEVPIRVTGPRHPRSARCRVISLATGRQVAAPPIRLQDGSLESVFTAAHPGLYRVEVAGGGFSATSEIIMITP